MKRFFSAACAIALASALAGCATGSRTGAISPPEVTRFHLGQPIARGQIAVEPFDAADANSIEFRSYAGAVARELIGTMLEVRIKRRSDGTVFWEGRATMEARVGTADSDRVVAVDQLARALFQDFPGESGRTIRAR